LDTLKTASFLMGFALLMAGCVQARAQIGALPKGGSLLTASRDGDGGPRVGDDLEARVDRLVRPLIDNHVVVGLSIGLVDGDKTYLVNYGTVSTKRAKKPDADTVYEIGSITKVFTGTLLADAVERKQVRLDDPVQKYLPTSVSVPKFDNTSITLLDLATQRSGLPRLPSNLAPKDPRNPYADYDEKQLYAFLSGHTLAGKPGEKYEYSNLGMGLLGFALARQASAGYETLVRTRILDPLGMTHTVISFTPDARAHLAEGTNADGEPESNWDLGALQGAGAIRSTVHDMLLFLKANLHPQGTPLEQAMLLAQKSEAPIGNGASIGLAWHILPGGKVTWHNGGTGGYQSMLAFNRDARQGVVVLCNTSGEIVTSLGIELMKVLGGENSDPLKIRAEARVDSPVLDGYRGEYQLAPGAEITITRSGDHLLAQLTGQPAFRIYPASETEFYYKVVDAQITFVRAGKIATTELILHQNGRDMTAKKK
jgi:serine-type D-Ala-D-Ala carboxypeptidase/endopeptidase